MHVHNDIPKSKLQDRLEHRSIEKCNWFLVFKYTFCGTLFGDDELPIGPGVHGAGTEEEQLTWKSGFSKYDNNIFIRHLLGSGLFETFTRKNVRNHRATNFIWIRRKSGLTEAQIYTSNSFIMRALMSRLLKFNVSTRKWCSDTSRRRQQLRMNKQIKIVRP